MDLFEDDAGPPSGGSNTPEFTVSTLSRAVKSTIEGSFTRVSVRGEVGRVSTPRSGHLYFDLKDEGACLAAVSWRGQAARLETRPEEGMEVVATGRMTTFPGQSKYQLIVDEVRPAGVGALMAMLEKRKRALEAEGLFAAERKRQLPFLPEVIGVVTSPSGAVIRDILHRLSERFPRRVLVWPVAVQGKACAPEVARAIRGFDALRAGGPVPRPDLLIVARGGGSIEDLWGFNEEIVARAAAECSIPLISAVGHETDTTLIDFVSDRRAPTPTAAAEMAVPVRLELLGRVDEVQARLVAALGRTVATRRQRLADLARALPRPDTLLYQPAQRLDRAGDALERSLGQAIERGRARLAELAAAIRPTALTAATRDAGRRLAGLDERLGAALRRAVMRNGEALAALASRLRPDPIRRAIVARQDALTRAAAALSRAMGSAIDTRTARLEALARTHKTLGYGETLKRGYAVVRKGSKVVTQAVAARQARALEIEFADGRVTVERPAERRRPSEDPPEQKSLF